MIWLGIGLYGAGALFWTATALAYGLRSPWYRSAVGWSLLGAWASLAAVLILAILLPLAPWPRPVELTLAVAVLVAIDLAGLAQLINVLRLQARDRKESR